MKMTKTSKIILLLVSMIIINSVLSWIGNTITIAAAIIVTLFTLLAIIRLR
ncbi:hypothetical protein P4K49_29545 [Bacillus cereus]|uniref:hypothetical protein n=1 Tax=Bacillus cereus group TaxID=86661 RepID=UPI00178C826A|nr:MULTISPECIES: hypothetical protein [Bacillus cereus group]MEB9619693.1 hypothetical protein [Bacillus cereus]MEB9643725.1 hypothetical protein [Bacillus cereus]MEB9734005.1 hypothetical protein [Bacillus cereus]MEC3174128.1 hypothetical protein [Bacillus cereus]